MRWAQLDEAEDNRREALEKHGHTLRAVEEWKALTPSGRQATDRDGNRKSHPGNVTACRGGITDVWFLDDGTVVLLPELIGPYLRAYDTETQKQGGKRNVTKTRQGRHLLRTMPGQPGYPSVPSKMIARCYVLWVFKPRGPWMFSGFSIPENQSHARPHLAQARGFWFGPIFFFTLHVF